MTLRETETALGEELSPTQRIEAWAAKHGVTMQVTFVPFSKSRNKAEESPSLNWEIRLMKSGKGNDMGMFSCILETDYSAGCGHCPSYKQMARQTTDYVALIAWECEHGRKGNYHSWGITGSGNPILPDLADVLYSLASESDVMQAGSFEEWAGDLGYDPDSRSDEKIYQACLEIGLKLNRSLGSAALDELREACEGY